MGKNKKFRQRPKTKTTNPINSKTQYIVGNFSLTLLIRNKCKESKLLLNLPFFFFSTIIFFYMPHLILFLFIAYVIASFTSIQRDSNPLLLGNEPSALTTRPGLLVIQLQFKLWKTIKIFSPSSFRPFQKWHFQYKKSDETMLILKCISRLLTSNNILNQV